ncbi:MAG: hypothetical protein PUH70_11975 [Clostridiales bacterium]|nr:hypothetical protein [Clostridiales bacterium]
MLESIRSLLLEEYSLGQWMLVFYLYSFAGWCWEVSLYLVKERRFVNRGFLTGPILPIYGFGALSVLLSCVPVKENVLLVALVGTLVASLVEYVTGWAMEALFHVRYWDYSEQPLNLNGHICAMSAATWAVFSAMIVCVVHPMLRPTMLKVPPNAALIAACVLTAFCAVDTVFAVRKALDLRRLLESMERYAKELEALHSGLDSLSSRIGDMVHAFAERVDVKQEELSAGVEHITAARDRVKKLMAEKRIGMEEGARQRFANFERILAEVAAYLPDSELLRNEIEDAKRKYDEQTALLRDERIRRMRRAEKVLRRNPTASSYRHSVAFDVLRQRPGKDSNNKAAGA